MNKRILSLALPNIITNITVPLLGMVDTSIVGHLDTEGSSIDYIGAISVGTMIFNFIYWNFGFLRMGTSGFTAQSYGARDLKESMNILTRALFIALLISFSLIILQYPISLLTRSFIENKNGVLDLGLRYFFILIWSAPATLGMYALKGWLIGMQDSKTPMYIAIMINLVNIFFSLLFVIKFKMKIEGVAYGTLIAQYSGLITTIVFWQIKYGKLKKYFNLKESINWHKMKLFFKVNSDIFLRTCCLIIVTTYFTIASSKMQYPTLAVNALLMQLFTLFSYFMDGFAFAGEAIVGNAAGARDHLAINRGVKALMGWGAAMSAIFLLIYILLPDFIVAFITDVREVRLAVADMHIWLALLPPITVSAFIFDGVFIGLTRSRDLLVTTLIATAAFVAIAFFPGGFNEIPSNSLLWLAFETYLLLRGILLAARFMKFQRISLTL